MKDQKLPSSCVVSIRLSLEQREAIEVRAAGKEVGPYLRGVLFPANDNEPPKVARTKPSEKKAFAAKTLALLGPAKHSLEGIAHGIASGLLPFSPDTEAALMKACADIADMKTLLMKALGIRES